VATGATLASGNNLSSQVAALSVNSDATGGGTLAPGNAGGFGTLTATGSVALGVAATAGVAHLALELGGTTAGTTYDQIVITSGTLALNNVELDGSLLNGFVPNGATLNGGGQFNFDGDTFYLVTGASNALTTTFTNQGAAAPALPGFNTVSFGGQEFAVSYTANFHGGVGSTFATGGHDIALMAIPEPNSFSILAASFGLALGLQRFRRRRK
jgi:fibronectin-binding autotransporter adhesin